jgi:hypothetical protein
VGGQNHYNTTTAYPATHHYPLLLHTDAYCYTKKQELHTAYTKCSGKIRTGSDKYVNKKRKRKKVPPFYAPHSLANKEMRDETVC